MGTSLLSGSRSGKSKHLKFAALAAAALFAGCLAASAAEADVIQGVRLQDGTHLLPQDRPWTVEGARSAMEQSIAALSSGPDHLPPPATDTTWRVPVELLENPRGRDVRDICDEYVTAGVAPFVQRVPARYETLEVVLADQLSGESSTCTYAFRGRTFIVDADDENQVYLPREFEQAANLAGSVVPFMYLFETSEPALGRAVQVFMAKLPQPSVHTAAFLEDAERLARYLYAGKVKGDAIAMIVAFAEGSDEGKLRTPGRQLMAVRGQAGDIILISSVHFMMSQWISDAKKSEPRRFVEVRTASPALTGAIQKAIAKGPAAALAKSYMEAGVYQDMRRVLEEVGAPAAARFDVDQVDIMNVVTDPATKFTMRMPVRFERKDGEWTMEGPKSKPRR